MKVLFAPVCKFPTIKDNPISYQLFLTCVKRVLGRKEHQTLNNSDPVKAVCVILFFTSFYNKKHLTKNETLKNGFDEL